VLGHARSGTSLVCRLLLDHLGVNFGTESQFIVRYQRKLSNYGDLSDDSRLRWLLQDISRERFFARTRQNFGFVFDVERALRSVARRTYSGVLRAIFEQFAASQGHVRWGDKTPDYIRKMKELGYPNVKVERLVQFRIHGVDEDLIKSARAHGFNNLSADDLVDLAIHGRRWLKG